MVKKAKKRRTIRKAKKMNVKQNVSQNVKIVIGSGNKTKVNKYNVFLAAFALIIVFLLLIFYSSLVKIAQTNEQRQETIAPTAITESKTPTGGFCKTNSSCFITACKDSQTDDCVNTTLLSGYSKNCKSYSDWIIKNQDSSRCACIDNACKMIK